jgi:hypothetical protein
LNDRPQAEKSPTSAASASLTNLPLETEAARDS